MKGLLGSVFDVDTLHDFGVIDTFSDGWECALSLAIERYKGFVYLRIAVSRKSKYGSSKHTSFQIVNAAGEGFSSNNAVDYFRQFEKCWRGEIGEADDRGSIARFFDDKVFGYQWQGHLREIPNVVEDPYAWQSLYCYSNRRMGEGYEISHINRQSQHVRSVLFIPRSSVAKLIAALQAYPASQTARGETTGVDRHARDISTAVRRPGGGRCSSRG